MDGQTGDDGQTNSGNDRVFDGFRPGQGQHRFDGQSPFAQSQLDHRACPRTFLPHHKWFMTKVPHRDVLSFQERMPARRNRDQFVLGENFGIQVFGFHQTFGQSQFYLANQKQALNGLGVGDFQLQFEVGMAPVKLAQCLRQKIRANRRARADGQPAPFKPAEFFHRPRRFLFQRRQALGVFRQQPSTVGEPGAPRQPLQQPNAQRALQFLDLLGHRGLAHPRQFRSAADTARPGHGMKQSQMISIHDITLIYVFHKNNVFVIYLKPAIINNHMNDSLMINTFAENQRLETIADGRRFERVVAERKTVVTPHELHELLSGEEAIELLDVRTPGEHAAAHVPGTRLLPLADLDATFYLEQRSVVDRPIYILCQTTRRARKAIKKFQRAGFHNCVLVTGGTQAWMEAGLPVNRGESKVLPLMRQVQIAVGTLAGVGAVLALTVNPLFAILPLFIGCGLVFAGVTGICGLALLLAKMPWNRLGRYRANSCCVAKR